MGWISCKERMPDFKSFCNESTFLVVKNGKTDIGCVGWYTDNSCKLWVEMGDEDEDITHWMPLPQPPHD